MNWSLLGQLTVGVIVGTWLLTRFERWGNNPPKSQEVEQDETVERVGHAFHWNGYTSQGDDSEIAFSLDSPDDRDEFLRRHGIGTK